MLTRPKSATKNEFLTIRDPGGSIRGMLDELRVLEGGGTALPPDRTAMLRLCIEACLTRKKSEKTKR